MIQFFMEHQLLFAPGSKFHYSNSGYYLMGVVIEEVSGRKYEDFIQEEILQPLAMTETGYDRSSDIVSNRASGYSLDEITYGYRNASCWHESQKYSAGALYSTVGDLYKWDQALLTEMLLSEESLSAVYDLYETNPTIFEETTAGYGWAIGNDLGHRYISHSGGVPGHAAFLLRYPDDRVTVVVLSNFDRERPDRIGFNLAHIVLDEE